MSTHDYTGYQVWIQMRTLDGKAHCHPWRWMPHDTLEQAWAERRRIIEGGQKPEDVVVRKVTYEEVAT